MPVSISRRQPPQREWHRATVTLSTIVSQQQTINARVWGHLAVHPALPADEPGYTVTSTTTGLRVCTLKTEAEAEQLTRLLTDRFDAIFALRDADKLRQSLPTWVASWLQGCLQAGKVVDMTGYQFAHKGAPPKAQSISPKPTPSQSGRPTRPKSRGER